MVIPFDNLFALASLLSVIPLIILYLLRPKPRVARIPSLMFLMKVEKEKKKIYSSITRIIKDPLFLIQLFVLIFLSVASAGPFYTSEEPLSSEHTVIVIDSSASMQTDGRFDDAISKAKSYISQENTVILAENVPVTALENAGASDARNLLDKLNPKATVADLSSAISSGMRILSNQGGRIVVISDFTHWQGQDPVSAKKLAESYGLNVDFVRVGEPTDNVGIIHGNVETEGNSYSYSSIVKNYNDVSKNVDIAVRNNGQITKTLQFNINAGSTKQFKVSNLKRGITKIQIEGQDSLMVDNTAYVSVPSFSDNDVLLVTDKDNTPSETALSLIPNVQVSVSENIPTQINNYDVVVLSNNERSFNDDEISRLETYTNNGGEMVFIAGEQLAPENAKISLLQLLPVKTLGITEASDGVTLKDVQSTQLTNDLKLDEIAVYKYLNSTPRSGSTTLISTENNIPMLTYWTSGEGTVVYLGLNDKLGENAWSNFHNLPEYPVFWVKLIGWLGGAGDVVDYNIETGTMTSLSQRQTIQTPTGNQTTERVLYDEAGVYKVAGKTIASNLFDDRESDTTIDGSGVIERASKNGEPEIVRSETYTAENDLDIYLIAAALLLIITEIYIIKKRGEL
ncbi:conserved hypothetical protein [Methanohalobium evestigatum Z-7303]|uniref:Uncharacterized protein n=1 Tax=Methanohalobium evestigatum (strain ATCC BAA-1072 / DSM 3721 / NBRC 107634 / OCM 161 / Z-7303) TaxID=644295 RepID=D7E6X0_METEZ|nr:conserved hypothetical protein [Methanohalobium evestigatum Z-7303]